MNQGRARMVAIHASEAKDLERMAVSAARKGWWSDAVVLRAQSQTYWVAALVALLEA